MSVDFIGQGFSLDMGYDDEEHQLWTMTMILTRCLRRRRRVRKGLKRQKPRKQKPKEALKNQMMIHLYGLSGEWPV